MGEAHPGQSEREPVHERLACEVRAARKMVLDAACGAAWPCPHCGSQRTHEDGWWLPRDLHEAAGLDGPIAMIAVLDLIRSGELEADSQHRVRLAR